MYTFFSNIRYTILFLTLTLYCAAYIYAMAYLPIPKQERILTQIYGLLALLYLYITLLISPLIRIFHVTLHGYLLKARRATGLSTFYFALLHAIFGFFGVIGGPAGFLKLPAHYLFAASAGFVALIISFLMTITSSDLAVKKLTMQKWKFLHRFVYPAGVAVLIHTFIRGTHFQQGNVIVPSIAFVLLTILLLLEVICTYKLLVKKLS